MVVAEMGGTEIFAALGDPTKQAEIYRCLENLKKNQNGWKTSIQKILDGSTGNFEEYFLLLQVVEDFLGKRYSNNSSPEDCEILHQFLHHWIKIVVNNATTETPSFLTNKMAQIFALVFAADFPIRWPTFFEDLFFCNNLLDRNFALFYLRVLGALDSEVVDRDVQRTPEQFDRNTKIKDAMREICIIKIAQSWTPILTSIPDSLVQCLVLDVIASYVDWVDTELVANDIVMPVIIERLANTETCESAVNAVSGLLQKGMPPEKKAELTLAVMTVLWGNSLLSVNEDSDGDDVVRVGSLVNTVGLVLVDICNKLPDSGKETKARCTAELEKLIVAALAVLSNRDAELSELPIDFLKSYLGFLFKVNVDISALVERIVSVALSVYTMPDDLNVDGEGEDEIEFVEYRKELRSLIYVIGGKKPEIILAALEPLVAKVIGETTTNIRDVEAITHLIYHLHEIVPNALLNSPKEGLSERACRLPLLLLERLQLDQRSSNVHVTYFETACRYERLLMQHPQPVVPIIAGAFLDQRGIAIPVASVRTRIVYLFCRFVKAHKAHLSPLVSEVINHLAPLLAVSPDSEGGQLLSSDDQAYIFEATATLIVFGNLTSEMKAQYFQELCSTLANKFEVAMNELEETRRSGDKEKEKLLIAFLSNVISFCSRMSKAFNNVQSMKACACDEIFIKLLKMFLNSLKEQNVPLLESTRQFANRLVVCLGDELLPMLPEVFSTLAQMSTDMDTMHHFLIFCHLTVAKYKKSLLKVDVDLANVLSVAGHFSMQEIKGTTATRDDHQRAIVYVQRAFLQLLFSVIASECTERIANAGKLDEVLDVAYRLAFSTDHTSEKLALSTLAKVVLVCPNWTERILRCALEVPALPHISPTDAGSTIVVHEAILILQTLKEKDSAGFENAVRQLLPVDFVDKLLTAMNNLKGRNLDKELMSLYGQVRQK